MRFLLDRVSTRHLFVTRDGHSIFPHWEFEISVELNVSFNYRMKTDTGQVLSHINQSQRSGMHESFGQSVGAVHTRTRMCVHVWKGEGECFLCLQTLPPVCERRELPCCRVDSVSIMPQLGSTDVTI